MSKPNYFFSILNFFLFFFILGEIDAQNMVQISGVVLDATNSEPMPGASVYWEQDVSTGVVTDLDGKFLIGTASLPAKIVVSFLGYEKSIRTINPNDGLKQVRIFLKPENLR